MNLFNSWGLDGSYVIIGFAVIIVIMAVLLIKSLKETKDCKARLQRFMLGENAESLEKVLLNRADSMDEAIEKSDRNAEDIELLCKSLSFAFQKFSIVKYDAFAEMGGKLSFSLCMLTENNDGFILSSVHSASEGCYTYIKEIIHGEPYVLLSDDEKNALEKAKNRKSVLDE